MTDLRASEILGLTQTGTKTQRLDLLDARQMTVIRLNVGVQKGFQGLFSICGWGEVRGGSLN